MKIWRTPTRVLVAVSAFMTACAPGAEVVDDERPPACETELQRPLGPSGEAAITHQPAGALAGTARFVSAREHDGVLSISLRAGEVDHQVDVEGGRAPSIAPGTDVRVELEVESSSAVEGPRLVLRDEGGRVLAWYERSRGPYGVRARVAALAEAIGAALEVQPTCITLGGQCFRHAVRYAMRAGEQSSADLDALEVSGEGGAWWIVVDALVDDDDRWPDREVCAISGVSDVSFDALAVIAPEEPPACTEPLPLPLGAITMPQGSPPIVHAPSGDLEAEGTFVRTDRDAASTTIRVDVEGVEHAFDVPLASDPAIAAGTPVRVRFVDRSSLPTALWWELTLWSDGGALLAHYVRAGGVGDLAAFARATSDLVGVPLGTRIVCRVPGGTCGRPGLQSALVGPTGEAAQGETLAITTAEGPLGDRRALAHRRQLASRRHLLGDRRAGGGRVRRARALRGEPPASDALHSRQFAMLRAVLLPSTSPGA